MIEHYRKDASNKNYLLPFILERRLSRKVSCIMNNLQLTKNISTRKERHFDVLWFILTAMLLLLNVTQNLLYPCSILNVCIPKHVRVTTISLKKCQNHTDCHFTSRRLVKVCDHNRVDQ